MPHDIKHPHIRLAPRPHYFELAEEDDERKNQGLAVGAELGASGSYPGRLPGRVGPKTELLFRRNPSFSLTVIER